MISKKLLFILTAAAILSIMAISCGRNTEAVRALAPAHIEDTEKMPEEEVKANEEETSSEIETESEGIAELNEETESIEERVLDTETETDSETEQPNEEDALAMDDEAFISDETADWGLAFGEAGETPVGNASAQELKKYDAYFTGNTNEKVIYITFDSGYENGNTEKILDALKKHNAPAAFFVVGNFLETSPDLVKRMQSEGHIVANHMYNHPDMEQISEASAFQEEVDKVADLYQEITGEEMLPYFRPPQGKYNAWNLKLAKQLGYRTFFWSLAYVDWLDDNQPTHEEAYEKLLTRIHPGAIVLLHSTSKTNGEIMDDLLTKWEEMGYSFGSLTDIK